MECGIDRILCLDIIDQVTVEGIHLREQFIKRSGLIGGRVVLHFDNYKAHFVNVEISTTCKYSMGTRQ